MFIAVSVPQQPELSIVPAIYGVLQAPITLAFEYALCRAGYNRPGAQSRPGPVPDSHAIRAAERIFPFSTAHHAGKTSESSSAAIDSNINLFMFYINNTAQELNLTTIEMASSKLRKQSRDLALLFAIGFWVVAFWLFAHVSYVPLKHFGAALVSPDRDAVDSALAYGALMIGFVPVILALVAVFIGKGLLVQFSQGDIFTPGNGKSLTRIGSLLIAAAVTALIVSPTFDPAIAEGRQSAGPDYMAIVLLMFGLVLRLFGNSFTLAAGIKAENDQII